MERDKEESLGSERDFPLIIPLMPATAPHRVAAICVVITLIVAAAAIAPFANAQIGRVDVFVPVLQTVLSAADLLTATLLLGQYAVQPHRGLLAVATAYLFAGSFAFLQTLTFPGGYGPTGVMGDGNNTPAWLFVFWHTTFPLSIMAYAFLKDSPRPAATPRSTGAGIVMTVVTVFAVVAALTWTITGWLSYLPAFYSGSVTLQTRFGNQINVALWLLGLVTLVILFIRRRTILDIWLIVTLAAWMPNFLVAAAASSARFSLGWYAARGFALVASCTLLCVLLTEMMVLYTRLASALTLQRRERSNQLMSIDAATAAIAHEIRSPLGAITLNASAALSMLAAPETDLEDMAVILKDIEQASLRVDSTIVTVRGLLKNNVESAATMRIDDIAIQVLRLMQHDLQAEQISVATSFVDHPYTINADRSQLQQVILNLVKNAIEAMRAKPVDQRQLNLSTRLREREVVLSIRDTGIGVPQSKNQRIFDAFFTTKPEGMGLGLAVCATIIDRHLGRLTLVATGSQGTEFEVALPISGEPDGPVASTLTCRDA